MVDGFVDGDDGGVDEDGPNDALVLRVMMALIFPSRRWQT